MKNTKAKVLKIVGIVCMLGAICLYFLGMKFGHYAIFAGGVACAVVGAVVGKIGGNNAVFGLCVIIAIVIGLELFMRVRDGYSGSGWYYWHLLRHPEDNKWS